ncbi:serine/threonine-protein kinase 11-interacting protein isoform X2 [Pyxicephalus adspersus]|uniref:serine/threonine-protein kinase 11-interacting protein isoform X2 n=1 Tax=Pyxicephalus adspersus TaxID=30357 RepID=UPI003B5A579F
MCTEPSVSMVHMLAHLLRGHGDTVLDGTSFLTLLTSSLQVFTNLFEQLFPLGSGSGFQALASHPTDGMTILRAQFLLDLAQKTPALKIVHSPDDPQVDLNIFPFKALRSLELECLPPHYLRGLRGVYSQMEVLTCTQCVSTLEEVISHCGGDLSSALPWLELHTLNFSNNTIHSLDKSLELLNCLRVMDLSQNCIKDCGSHLKVLSELEHLNMSFNMLESIPELSFQSTLKLHTLILSYNQLSSANGLEQLSNLQHLDLSYNFLPDHSQFKCLARMHNLKQLCIEGNPLCNIIDYRVRIAQHLSQKVSDKVLLDGMPLTPLEKMNVQLFRDRGMLSRPCRSTTESSCTGELSDSCSATEKNGSRTARKKPRKVKIRSASISEPSDSECEQRLQPVVTVLKHQSDIERTDSFREKFGIDWLQYRSHLEEELNGGQNSNASPSRPIQIQPFTKSKSSPIILQTPGKTDNPSPAPKNPSPARPPTPEVSTVTAPADQLIEQIEDAFEDALWKPGEVEEDVIEDALCAPVTACPILDGHPRNPDWPWVFLRVTPQHLVEIDLERGRVQLRRELQCLRDIQTSVTQWNWNGEEQELPVLTLFFDSVCEDKQCARYVILDNTPKISIKTLLDVLNPILEENQRLMAERLEGLPKLKCLKCKNEFTHQEDSGVVSEGETQDKLSRDHTSCPSCGSFHVILAPTHQDSFSSTPTQPLGNEQPQEGALCEGQKSFYLGEDEKDGSQTGSSSPASNDSVLNGKTTLDANASSLTGSYRDRNSTPPTRHNSLVLQDNWQVSPSSNSPQQTLDFRLVDHRLKLYLDMEILGGDMEEFQCYMKVPVVRFGKEGEFWTLVVVTNQKIYFLEITGDTSGSPSDWLLLKEEQKLTSLTHVHVGLKKQTLHLGFGTTKVAYTLLTRNRHFSIAFSQNILDSFSELPRRYRKALDYSIEEELTQAHPLCHLLQDNLEEESQEASQEESQSQCDYSYTLVYFLQEDKPADCCANSTVLQQNTASPAARAQGAANATAVSLLLTQTHMYILEETHQWFHTPSPPGEKKASGGTVNRFVIKEKQPISSISSVHLYNSATLHLRIKLYDESQQKESAWLLWTEDPDLPKEIAEWLKVPWEAEYHINFNQIIHETLD